METKNELDRFYLSVFLNLFDKCIFFDLKHFYIINLKSIC